MTLNHRVSILLVAALCAALTAAPVSASARLAVSNAWIRALPGGLPAGGYFTLHNGGAVMIRLVGASSPACGMLMLHKSDYMNGMTDMQDVPAIDIAPGGTVTFAPGGYHLMCTDPTPAVAPGKSVPITLQFAGGTTLEVDFAVRGARGQ